MLLKAIQVFGSYRAHTPIYIKSELSNVKFCLAMLFKCLIMACPIFVLTPDIPEMNFNDQTSIKRE